MGELEKAIAAVKQGKKAEARTVLLEILRADPQNARAWLWMSAAVKSTEQKEECLKKVLELDPYNKPAQRGLDLLRKKQGAFTANSSAPFDESPALEEVEEPFTFEPVEPTEEEIARKKKEAELYKLEGLLSYELSQGASKRVLISKYVKKGFPKESVEMLINELDSQLKPVQTGGSPSLSTLLLSTEGRVTRTTYWLFGLAYFVLSLIAVFVDFLLIGGFSAMMSDSPPSFFGVFTLLLGLIGAYPSIVIQIKRLHDRNRPGWFFLLNFVPFVNLWIGIEVAFLPGTPGANDYGPDPRLAKRQLKEAL
mgnify:CR=1 FL=1